MATLKELRIKQLKGELDYFEEVELEAKLNKARMKRVRLQRQQKGLKSSDISTFARTINHSTYTSSFDRLSCVHFDKVSNFCKGGTKRHNLREYKPEHEPDYLLPKEHRIEFDKERDAWELKDENEKVITPQALFKAEYKKYKGVGKRPKFENCVWEAIVVLNESHTLDDLLKVKDEVEKLLNITCYRVAIHRDEGHIDEKGKVCINYHAHLDFFTLKDRKQQYQRNITRRIMPIVQTEVAKILQMQRGKVGSNTKHLQPKEYRRFIKQENKRQQLLKQMSDKDKLTSKQINELKSKLETAEQLKFNKTIAYEYLKSRFIVYNEKFDKLGEPYNNKENPLRKMFFSEITAYTKAINPKEIDFLTFTKHLDQIENKFNDFLNKELQELKAQNAKFLETARQRNADIKTLNEKIENLKAQLDTAKAEKQALEKNLPKAAEAHQEKAAEQKIEAAADIPSQNAKDTPKTAENEKKVETPQEKEKVIEIDYMQDYLIVACLKLEKTYQESNSKWNVYKEETKKRVAREVKSLMNEIDEHLKSRYYQDLTNPQVRECVEKAHKTLKEFKTGDKRAFLEKIGSLSKSQSR